MRSIEDVIRIKRRQADELVGEITTLEAALKIMEKESEPLTGAEHPEPVVAQPVKRWP